jgi:hypothetical protein
MSAASSVVTQAAGILRRVQFVRYRSRTVQSLPLRTAGRLRRRQVFPCAALPAAPRREMIACGVADVLGARTHREGADGAHERKDGAMAGGARGSVHLQPAHTRAYKQAQP